MNFAVCARIKNIVPLILLDSVAVSVSYGLALRFREASATQRWSLVQLLPMLIAVYLLVNLLFGLYRCLWHYASSREAFTVGAATAISTVAILELSLLMIGEQRLPLSVIGLGGGFAWGLFVAVRYRRRMISGLMGHVQRLVGSPDRQRVLIVGAGTAGHLLARQLKSAPIAHHYELVGFVDDDPQKLGMWLAGGGVLGDRHAIPRLVAERGVGLIVIAIHTLSGPLLRDLLAVCLTTPARVKIGPDLLGAIDRSQGVPPLRDITEEDLLGRQLSRVDEAACRHIIAGKVVLVTGAAGSIGSELCRQILSFEPQTLLMLDTNETGLHELKLALAAVDNECAVPIVADVVNHRRIERIFAQHRPQVVFHAAAYKHVPMMELHPDEAMRVNVLGTVVMTRLAECYGVERFVLISTDKAVHPSSIMGATKHVGELLMMGNQPLARDPQRRALFTAVRFGNVLGSRGSVAPLLVRQIERGGPVTITHPAMTRYFISVSEAVSLVIEAATLTEGGDIFMLDMGKPITIEELACKMIRLRGLRPHQDIPIVYSGIRPGEKLDEELIATDEAQTSTAHPKIFRLQRAAAVDRELLGWRLDYLIELLLDQQLDAAIDALWQLARDEAAPLPLMLEHSLSSISPDLW